MTEEYKGMVVEWGLEAFIENFDSEGINDESFKLLDKETIHALISKSGPRLIFMQKYKQYLADIHQGHSGNTLESSLSTTSTDTFDNASVYTYVPDEEFMDAIFSTPLRDVSNLNDGKRKFDEITDNVEQAGPSKRAKIEHVFPRGLEFALNKYPEGKIVLSAKNKLTNELRNKLTKLVITELYAVYGIKNIRAEILEKASNEIEALFPSEKHETYYIPYNSLNKSGPKGKLYTKFINTKTSLRLADASSSGKSSPMDERNIGEEKSDDIESGYLNFLRVGIEPITRVLEAWEQTYSIRKRLYLNADLTKIYDDFPCLSLNCGLELIESDFNKIHEGCIDIIYTTWEKVSSAIIAEAKERKINSIATDNTANTILILPYLFSPLTIKKTRKGCTWRPSRSEVQESFFSHIRNIGELRERTEARKEKLKQFGLTVQPFAVIVGDLSNPTYIIVVDEVQYKIDTGIRTLELLFKLFHGLDIEYPPESEHIWLFIEELVFKLKPRKTSSSTSTVIADIMYHMQK